MAATPVRSFPPEQWNRIGVSPASSARNSSLYIFKNCGYKFNRWYHMIWMGKNLGAHGKNQPPVRPYPEVRDKA